MFTASTLIAAARFAADNGGTCPAGTDVEAYRVNLAKPVNLAKRQTLRADELVKSRRTTPQG